jgi:probable phosphoglycerate mutase
MKNTNIHRPIYLLRHGAVDLPDGERRYIGCRDVPLSEQGRSQALNWAERFTGAGLAAIYCSPLSRCLETAEMIGERCGLEPTPAQALQEINLGEWEGRSFKTIRTLHPRDFARRGDSIADFRTPGGESFEDLQQRAWPAFEEMAGRHQGPVLMVTHAGVIRVLICRMLGMPLDRLFRIGSVHGGLTLVLNGPDGYRLQGHNLTCLP